MMGKQRHPGSFKLLSNATVRAAVKELAASTSRLETPQSTDLVSLKRPRLETEPALPHKKQKTEVDNEIVSYTKHNLPPDLRKYYAQRHQLFSLYDEGIQMDREGWWSVTPELIAAHIAERCRCELVVDAFCGVGGNAIQFALTCEKVIAIDNNATRLACARHNAKIYGVEDRIEFICTDFVEWARRTESSHLPIDVVFLSPPWGGIDYRSPSKTGYEAGDRIEPPTSFDLSTLKPLPARELVDLCRSLTPHVALYLPKTTDATDLAALMPKERVEVEEQHMGQYLKAVTAYFGELAQRP